MITVLDGGHLLLNKLQEVDNIGEIIIFIKFINLCDILYKYMIETTKINDIVALIAAKFNPDKIILFGSYATDTPSEDSDLDLLIIKDTDLPQHKRSFDIQKSLIGSMIPIDILVYTNKEFEQEKDVKYSFINSVIKTSKIVYECK